MRGHAPDTTIASGPPAETSETDATFAFASEAGASFECSLDGVASSRATRRAPTATWHWAHTSSRSRRATPPAIWTRVPPATAGRWRPRPELRGLDRDRESQRGQLGPAELRHGRHGSEATLKVDSRAGANARALVGFALPAIPAGCQLADVKLRLYAATFKSGRTLRANQPASV